MVADMQLDCGALNTNAVKHHLLSFLTFLCVPLLHSSRRLNFLSLFLAMFDILFHVFTLMLQK